MFQIMKKTESIYGNTKLALMPLLTIFVFVKMTNTIPVSTTMLHSDPIPTYLQKV